MLARARMVGLGAAFGLGAARLQRALEEDPSLLPSALDKFFPNRAAAADGEETPPKKKDTVAVVKMSGTIAAPSPSPLGAASNSLNISKYEDQLKGAYRIPSLAAVVIEINSPGGSPVQSALLHNRLRALKAEHPETPLLCFCTDVCASGGYYIAAACDEIHVMPSSIVGSIGVVSPSIGLSGLLKQYGVEDRTLTAGTSKAGDSPLAPRDPVAVAKKKRLLEELHDDFMSSVTAARGDRLKHADAAAYARACGDRKSRRDAKTALFDGSVYGGKTAVRLGLADFVYDEMRTTLKARFGGDVKIRELKTRPGVLESLKALQEAGAEAQASALVREARVALEQPQGVAGPFV